MLSKQLNETLKDWAAKAVSPSVSEHFQTPICQILQVTSEEDALEEDGEEGWEEEVQITGKLTAGGCSGSGKLEGDGVAQVHWWREGGFGRQDCDRIGRVSKAKENCSSRPAHVT